MLRFGHGVEEGIFDLEEHDIGTMDISNVFFDSITRLSNI